MDRRGVGGFAGVLCGRRGGMCGGGGVLSVCVCVWGVCVCVCVCVCVFVRVSVLGLFVVIPHH